MTWRQQHLPEIVAQLARRPGHEAVRTAVTDILRYGFHAALQDIDHEVRMPEVRGRADTLFGATLFEFKSDLRREMDDVLARLPDYLRERENKTRRRFLGIATDGATFHAFELRAGALVPLGRPFQIRADKPDALLAWLEPALADRDDQPPEPRKVQQALGRDSFAFNRAFAVLERLWARWKDHSEVALKRQLWDSLLREVYGTAVGDDRLFLQHTYLTIVAKTIAARVLALDVDGAGADAILSGKLLQEAGIYGAVESDFFDRVLQDQDGADLVSRIARQAGRFRSRDVEADVLKALYESLIDPAQRRDLGEYYTPDWLAAKLAAAAVTAPLEQRVLDPACGSGTFLFHALRRLLAAAEAAGLTRAAAVERCVERVRGLDVHPVAVIIARVTWLLALGPAVEDRPAELHVPVYLGDAMQWNVSQVHDAREVRVPVPGERPLSVPAGFAEDQARFDRGLRVLTEGVEADAAPAAVRRDLARIPGAAPADVDAMGATYARLLALYKDGRDHIWPFVLRNLVRPLWLSRPDQRADVLLGNPPWVAYRHLSAEMKPRLRDACQALDLWVGQHLATQQDLSALFWARGAHRYLNPGGTIAFVLPYAALNRPAFAGLRRGTFQTRVQVRITEAWSFDERVQPLFPVPACVLIGRREAAGPLPDGVWRHAGALPRRDATEAEADRALRRVRDRWPPVPTLEGASPYRARFKQGATIVPRRFFIVEREAHGRLGSTRAAPIVRGKAGKLDKHPWSTVEPPRGPVEAEFLRPVLLGETIAPFRVLAPVLGVVPLDGRDAVNAETAGLAGHRHLAAWLRDAEGKWNQQSAKRIDDRPVMTLSQRIDHMRGLSQQAGAQGSRLVYTKAGTLLSAAVLEDAEAVVDHMAYWTSVRSVGEGRYLSAILNSETVRERIEPMQPKGQGGARHFDNLVWELLIPGYDRRNPLHVELAEAAASAEGVAGRVALDGGAHFTRQRRAIRDALAADGIAAEMDRLVARLLDG